MSPAAAGVQIYQIPGFGGGNRSYSLHWKQLKGATAEESGLSDFTKTLHYLGDRYWPQGATNWHTGAPSLFDSGNHVGADTTSLVNDLAIGGNTIFNPIVLTEIELPNGASYKFSYDIYGRIEKISYPTGGEERMTYQQLPSLSPGQYAFYKQANVGVSTRKVYEAADSGTPYQWNYSVDTTGYTYNVKSINPDGTRSERLLTQGFGPGPTCNDCAAGGFGYENALTGMAYDERGYDSADHMISRKLTTWAKTSFPGTADTTRDWHPRVTQVESIICDPLTSACLSNTTTTGYAGTLSQITDALNPNVVAQYGFSTVVGTLGALERSVETTYRTDAAFVDRNMRSLPDVVTTKDAGGVVRAKSQVFYDDAGYGVSGVYGLATRTRSWHDIANDLFIETKAKYDAYGNVIESTDGRGNVTQTEYSSAYGYAYPTKVTTPVPDGSGVNGSNTALTTLMAYDLTTGLPTSTTDTNGQTTTISYSDPITSILDPLLRVRKVTAPNGQQTITEYGVPDIYGQLPPSQRFVKTRSQIDETKWKEALTWADGLGRAIKSQSINAESGDVFVETAFDAFGRPWKTSNPYRTGETVYWTENFYDTAGRMFKVKSPDNAEVETFYSLATTGSQIGTVVTVNDQAEKQRRSITNALGQLTRVDEPDNSSATGNLGSISSPNQPTLYSYDTLNNLIGVQQSGDTTTECGGASTCTQTRAFAYDALSRLKSATNPESGLIQYVYDNNGNLASKVDARGVKTDYVYDALNRVTNRNYSLTGATPPNYQGSPNVSYFYDNITNAKGKLITVTNGTGLDRSTTGYTAFDILGRVTAAKQTTDGGDPNGYTTGYVYNLSGALIEETYPSGRVVKNVLDNNGDLSIVQSKKTTASGYWNYADSFAYNSAGSVTSMQLGNGRWESTTFNSRLQPTQIALGATKDAAGLLKLNYTYGTTNNNGNVLSQAITVPTVGSNNGFVATQTYSYDSLNRINDAAEMLTPTGGSATQTWKQTFVYDRYGNRTFDTDQSRTTTIPTACPTAVCNPSANASDNRLRATDGYTFDNAGNTTKDAELRKFTYDAENKQTKVETTDANGTVIATNGEYWYDGDGKRIKKKAYTNNVLSEETIFVYDAAGKLVAEYSTVVEPASTAKVAYLTNDHLGSPRINTDRDGIVIARHDYQPFGEEIATSQRTTALSYADDTVRKQFTGYERDKETGLDFAQARYFKAGVGRFSSPDPIMISPKRLFNPQMINLYVYAVNNPLFYVDPDGEKPYQLGQATVDALYKSIKETEALLRKDKKNQTLIDQLASLKNDLAVVTIGNKVVGGWLGALIKRGEANGLKMEDFKITTEPGKDLAEAVETAKQNGQPGGNISLKLGALLWGMKSTTATVIGKDIYILTPSNAYQDSAALARGEQLALPGSLDPISKSDVNLFGGSALRHEQDHRDNGADEVTAYTTQIDFLDRMNTNRQFKNQEYFKAVREGLVDLRESYRPNPQ